MVYVKKRSTESMFWDKVDRTTPYGPNGDCWRWTAAKTGTGYGRFNFGLEAGGVGNAHIYSWILAGNITHQHKHLDHLCCVKDCVNPKHLEEVSSAENTRRHFRNQTHCKRGHEWTEDNTRLWRGVRACKTCINLQQQAYASGKRVRAFVRETPNG